MANTTNVTTKRTRRKYSAEFKSKAVKLAMQGGTSIATVARDLGVIEPHEYGRVVMAVDHAKAHADERAAAKSLTEAAQRLGITLSKAVQRKLDRLEKA